MDIQTKSTDELRRLLVHIDHDFRSAGERERGFLAGFAVDILKELRSRATDPFTLDDGLHQDSDGRTLYNVHTHRGVKVVRVWDRNEGGSEARVVWGGVICNFNTTADAEAWLDEQIDAADCEGCDPEGRPWR